MKITSFLITLAIILAAYYYGEYGTLFGLLPEGGSALNAWVKGFLLGLAALITVNKARDFVLIGSGIKFAIILAAISVGYFYEAGRGQREGRKVLAKNLGHDAADGAYIHVNEGAGWSDANTIIEFNRSPINVQQSFPALRKIPLCNIQFPGFEQILTRVSEDKLKAGTYYWTYKKETSGLRYVVLAVLPDEEHWFFQTKIMPDEKALAPEIVENGRIFTENGAHIDRACTSDANVFRKKAYSGQNVIQSEWEETADGKKTNEIFYDRSGKLLNGQVETEFTYNVDKGEEFKNGFGKAGKLKCSGYYTYSRGKKDGPFVLYYPGHVAKAFVGEYSNGAPVGMIKQFNPNGKGKRTWQVGEPDSPSFTYAR